MALQTLYYIMLTSEPGSYEEDLTCQLLDTLNETDEPVVNEGLLLTVFDVLMGDKL